MNADGTIAAGSGFFVDHPAVGEYVIGLPLAGASYTVTANPSVASPSNSTAYTQGANGWAQVSIRTSSLPADLAFGFIAVGPQAPIPIPIRTPVQP